MKKVIPIVAVGGATPLPSEAELEASIQLNLRRLKPSVPEIQRLLHEELRDTVHMEATQHVKNGRLLEAINKISALMEPAVACGKGCSHCCHMAVGISAWEAEQIGKYIGIKPANPPAITIENALEVQEASIQKYMGKTCPFLQNNECSIYEVRPFACRTNFNISAYPQQCNLFEHPQATVPNFDLSNLWTASAVINSDPPVFGDLRQFFPMDQYGAFK